MNLSTAKVKSIIYNRGIELTPEFVQFLLNEGLSKEFLPYRDEYAQYRLDWNIICLDRQWLREQFEPYYVAYTTEIPLHGQWLIRNWLNRISCKLFKPENLILSLLKTDLIQLRIATSMLNKLDIVPEMYRNIIFDNMISTYWARKKVYTEYYYKHVLDLPF